MKSPIVQACHSKQNPYPIHEPTLPPSEPSKGRPRQLWRNCHPEALLLLSLLWLGCLHILLQFLEDTLNLETRSLMETPVTSSCKPCQLCTLNLPNNFQILISSTSVIGPSPHLVQMSICLLRTLCLPLPHSLIPREQRVPEVLGALLVPGGRS